MNTVELLEKYPKTKKVIKDWFLGEMMSSIKDDSIPKSFKKHIIDQGIEDKRLIRLIDLNPRMLLDVFDENNVIIVITYHENIGFSFEVEESVQNRAFDKRRDAERAAIEIAFDILESDLNK